ncbi:MAG: hypothetical protein IM607_07790 [Cytophagales bacterium]|nr:hypothetical protein [Cytophagales bacterium]
MNHSFVTLKQLEKLNNFDRNMAWLLKKTGKEKPDDDPLLFETLLRYLRLDDVIHCTEAFRNLDDLIKVRMFTLDVIERGLPIFEEVYPEETSLRKFVGLARLGLSGLTIAGELEENIKDISRIKYKIQGIFDRKNSSKQKRVLSNIIINPDRDWENEIDITPNHAFGWEHGNNSCQFHGGTKWRLECAAYNVADAFCRAENVMGDIVYDPRGYDEGKEKDAFSGITEWFRHTWSKCAAEAIRHAVVIYNSGGCSGVASNQELLAQTEIFRKYFCGQLTNQGETDG